MATDNRCCTIAPYFRVHDGAMERFRDLLDRFVRKTKQEPGCLFYGFSFDGDEVHCREGYEDADAALAHLGSVAPLIEEALTLADLVRLEVHGPGPELEKLREPMAAFGPRFFTLELGFRRQGVN